MVEDVEDREIRQPGEGGAVADRRQVLDEPVVQAQAACLRLGELHDCGGGEDLRLRADAEPVVVAQGFSGGQVGEPEATGANHLAVVGNRELNPGEAEGPLVELQPAFDPGGEVLHQLPAERHAPSIASLSPLCMVLDGGLKPLHAHLR